MYQRAAGLGMWVKAEGGGEPAGESLLHLGELGFGAGGDALEEVISALDPGALLGFRCEFEEAVEDVGRAELVMVAGEKELWAGALCEEVVGVIAAGGPYGQAEADQGCDAWVSAAGAQAYVGSEGEAGEEDGFPCQDVQVIECGADVFDLAAAFIVSAFRETGATEVEAQGG